MVTYKGKTAEKLLKKGSIGFDICLEYMNTPHNSFNKFIFGKSTFALIERNVSTGEIEHNAWAVVETFYRKYKENPEAGYDKLFEKYLGEGLLTETSITAIKNGIDCLMYQLQCEKQHTAAFSIDCKKMLNNLKTNIETNRKAFELGTMMQDLENYNKRLQESFNERIL